MAAGHLNLNASSGGPGGSWPPAHLNLNDDRDRIQDTELCPWVDCGQSRHEILMVSSNLSAQPGRSDE